MILAAGGSTRLGRPKALVDFGGRTCLERVVDACRDGGFARPILVVPPPPSPVEAFTRSTPLDIDRVVNPAPERGQTSSLRLALERLPPDAEGFAVLPVDHPLLDGGSLRTLRQAFASRGPDTRGVVPIFGGRRGHPLLAERSLAIPLLALPDGGSARSVLGRGAAIAEVPMADDRTTIDLDTPDDLEACRRRWTELSTSR